MKKEALLKKFESYIEEIEDALENISTLLELDCDDDELSEMSIKFRDVVESALTENDECTVNDIIEYIRESL